MGIPQVTPRMMPPQPQSGNVGGSNPFQSAQSSQKPAASSPTFGAQQAQGVGGAQKVQAPQFAGANQKLSPAMNTQASLGVNNPIQGGVSMATLGGGFSQAGQRLNINA